MAFADYLDLRVAVSEQIPGRNINDVMPRLVKLAEAHFNRKIRHERMLTNTDLTVVSGEVDLPSDYVEALRVKDGERLLRASDGEDVPCRMSAYAVEGNKLKYGSGDATLALTYYAAIPTLTASVATSNWLLEQFPDVYLYGVSYEAAKFLQDAELASAMMGLRDESLRELKVMNNRRKWRDGVVTVGGINP